MCGDGANDLLALREADISLGIQKCDASYGASFAINNLLDVDQVIRESKNTVSNIMQMFIYMVSTFIAAKFVSILFITNASDHDPNARFYYNFTSILLFPLLISLSKPIGDSTSKTPVSSFMTLYAHILIWGNVVLLIGTIIGSYFYFRTTIDFIDITPKTLDL